MRPRAILAEVADLFGVPLSEIAGNRRWKRLVPARQAAAWALRRAGVGVVEAGEFLHRDHTTIIYSARQAEQTAQEQPAYARQLRELAARIGLPLPDEIPPPPTRRPFVLTPQIRLWMWAQRDSIPIVTSA